MTGRYEAVSDVEALNLRIGSMGGIVGGLIQPLAGVFFLTLATQDTEATLLRLESAGPLLAVVGFGLMIALLLRLVMAVSLLRDLESLTPAPIATIGVMLVAFGTASGAMMVGLIGVGVVEEAVVVATATGMARESHVLSATALLVMADSLQALSGTLIGAGWAVVCIDLIRIGRYPKWVGIPGIVAGLALMTTLGLLPGFGVLVENSSFFAAARFSVVLVFSVWLVTLAVLMWIRTSGSTPSLGR